MAEIEQVVIVRFDEDGEIDYTVIGDDRVRLFIVDERAPHDRVYEYTSSDPVERLREIIPRGSIIGSQHDDRHEAIVARILAAREGRAHLEVVDD